MSEPILQFRNQVPKIADKSNFIRLCISGPSDTGKSQYIQFLYDQVFKYHYDLICVFCKSDDQRLAYKHGMHTNLVYADYRADVIEKIIANNKGLKPVRCLVILDDIIDRASRFNKSIFDLAISGRHNLISLCLVTHSLALLDPVVRGCFSHLCLTRQTNEVVYTAVYDDFLQMLARCEYPDKTNIELRKAIVNYMHANTANWNVLFINLLDIKRTNKTIKQIIQVTNSRMLFAKSMAKSEEKQEDKTENSSSDSDDSN